ncbi:PTS sugar transporter subunit IIB [Melissococcus plutonius]|uniref:PTS sysytem, mannitol-specific enzyme II, B component n=1 Tax=Melissococcus plutonius (strain ATCC 35311 / DSM 29964 / CIP 104052 / LMG 20360 / NCIMB 702443) TaxID=940190 RepID=F3Y8I9_MELPT|nr:PTS sugar transporter subunit IIB [Melissococcus plutonius]AIM24520.1 putative PTS system protein [Melissococcus plutonius S1]KMT24571.1 putative PTS system protein [Melissococcus plutonius]KMT27284.1 putative PTS system protein [Melissococcus plutonius]KMT27457.1 putative PTS system protein [Melissococcus plutonius]KMT29231.1 putative PTS system protein [Melissococcus plutonius]
MKFAAVCSSGLGSSFMVEMNIKTALNTLGIHNIEVTHYDMGSASEGLADAFFIGADLAESATHLGNIVILHSIIDMDELIVKVKAECQKQGLL